MDSYRQENPIRSLDLQREGDKLLLDTYEAIIMWMSKQEIEDQMRLGMAGRAQVWRDSTSSRLYTYIEGEHGCCRDDNDLWQSRQKSIIKYLLGDVVSALDYMATAALQLSPEYCYASKGAQENAMKAAYFPFLELATAGVDFVEVLHNQGIKGCRELISML